MSVVASSFFSAIFLFRYVVCIVGVCVFENVFLMYCSSNDVFLMCFLFRSMICVLSVLSVCVSFDVIGLILIGICVESCVVC